MPWMPLAQHLIISRATAGGRFQSITATRSGEASIPASGAVLNHTGPVIRSTHHHLCRVGAQLGCLRRGGFSVQRHMRIAAAYACPAEPGLGPVACCLDRWPPACPRAPAAEHADAREAWHWLPLSIQWDDGRGSRDVRRQAVGQGKAIARHVVHVC